MDNDKTIFMQPENESKQSQNVDTHKNVNKSNTGKRVAATTGAALFEGAVGGVGVAAGASVYNKANEHEVEVKVDEVPTVAEASKPELELEVKVEEEGGEPIPVDANGEPDYTGNAGADPVSPNPVVQTQSSEPEVQVLGIYEAQGDNGQTMEAAILTDGQDVAAVIDVDGDGTADILAVDKNHNNQIDEDEVVDVSHEYVPMSQFENSYLTQQQIEIQQENDTFSYNADNQMDCNNDPDLSFL